jgi:two-component system, chemotaxis family, response regulator Rcp1
MSESIEILLVENNLGDVRLTQEALKDSKLFSTLRVVYDGEEAMDFLWRRGNYADAPRPDIILLDLNLPRKDGREVLREIKEDNSLQRIPVVVMTTSENEVDILKSYQLHANCYITKPVDFNRFVTIVQSIETFWFQIVKLPPHSQ